MTSVLIEGGHAGRIEVREGQLLEVVNVDGNQVCDFFAFNLANTREAVSPTHMRTMLGRIFLKQGDQLWSVLRNPMFELVEDTAGEHDFFVAACDPKRYSMDFGISEHRSCRENLAGIVADLGIPYEYLPDPVNFFQPTPMENREIGVAMSPAKPGDRVVLQALMDIVAVGSACPQDQTELNNFKPTDIKFTVT